MAVETCVWPLYEVVEGKVHPELRAQEQAVGGEVPEDAGSLRPHVRARQRVDDRRGPEGSGLQLGGSSLSSAKCKKDNTN